MSMKTKKWVEEKHKGVTQNRLIFQEGGYYNHTDGCIVKPSELRAFHTYSKTIPSSIITKMKNHDRVFMITYRFTTYSLLYYISCFLTTH